MTSPQRRLSARDYKHGSGPARFDFNRYRQFAMGLAAGLLVALVVYIADRRPHPELDVAAEPHAPKSRAPAPAAAEEPAEQYDFYSVLPKFEVVIPEREREVKRDMPSVPVEQPGLYVLQASSSQNEADADRMRQRLAKLGIDATVQRIAVDTDVYYRVRIGPMRDLTKLNATRRQLRAADIDAWLIRLPD